MTEHKFFLIPGKKGENREKSYNYSCTLGRLPLIESVTTNNENQNKHKRI